MPHAQRRSRGQNRHPIKPDPDSATNHSPSAPDSGTIDFGLERKQAITSTNSNYGSSSSYLPVEQSFYRGGRSDARK